MEKRKNRKIHRTALTGIICSGIMLAISGGVMYARSWTAVTNHIQTDIVDISLTEYQQKSTDQGLVRVPWEDGDTILPGDRISLIPQIENTGADCYVRARLEYGGSMDASDLQPIGMSSDWILAGDGYYYYTKVLPKENSVELFSNLSVSDALNPELAGETGQLFISIDAIQSQNFSPNYDEENPWGDVVVLSNEKDASSQVRVMQVAEKDKFQILWQGDTEKLAVNTEDLFENFGSFLPGDVVSDSMSIRNNDSDPVNIYFRSELNDEEHLLAEQIGLKIEMCIQGENRVIYEGNLLADGLTGEQPLGSIPANTKGEFVYTLSMPAELDNTWTLASDQVRWYFSTEPVRKVDDADPVSTKAAKTGDTLPVVCLVLSIVSLSVCLVLLPYRERRR